MYSCGYMNSHNYGTTLNPKKKHEGWVGEVGQAMAEGNKNNGTLKHHVTWRPRGHMNPYILSAVWKKNIFRSFSSSASDCEKPHLQPSS